MQIKADKIQTRIKPPRDIGSLSLIFGLVSNCDPLPTTLIFSIFSGLLISWTGLTHVTRTSESLISP